jgi:hypothetical protein
MWHHCLKTVPFLVCVGPSLATAHTVVTVLLVAVVLTVAIVIPVAAAWSRAVLTWSAPLACTAAALVPLVRDDVAVNPNDTEESIWAFLCEAQMQGPEAARDIMLKVRWSSWFLGRGRGFS